MTVLKRLEAADKYQRTLFGAGGFRYTRFRYLRFYCNIIRSIKYAPAVTVETAAQAH
jgi:hypothetical protein